MYDDIYTIARKDKMDFSPTVAKLLATSLAGRELKVIEQRRVAHMTTETHETYWEWRSRLVREARLRALQGRYPDCFPSSPPSEETHRRPYSADEIDESIRAIDAERNRLIALYGSDEVEEAFQACKYASMEASGHLPGMESLSIKVRIRMDDQSPWENTTMILDHSTLADIGRRVVLSGSFK